MNLLLIMMVAFLPSVDAAHRTIRFDTNQDKTVVLTIHREVGLAIQFGTAPDVIWYSNRESYTVEELSPTTFIVKVILEAKVPMNLFALVGDDLVEILVQQTSSLEHAVRKAQIEILPKRSAKIGTGPPSSEGMELELLEKKKLYDMASFSVWEMEARGSYVIYQKPNSPPIEIVDVLKGRKSSKASRIFPSIAIDGPFIRVKVPPLDLDKKEKVFLSVVLQYQDKPIDLELFR